jgi:hypothetical protein
MKIGEVRYVDDKLSIITSGQYMGEYGVSNYWCWRSIRKDGTLSKKEYSGYNNGEHLFSAPVEHEIIIRIKE